LVALKGRVKIDESHALICDVALEDVKIVTVIELVHGKLILANGRSSGLERGLSPQERATSGSGVAASRGNAGGKHGTLVTLLQKKRGKRRQIVVCAFYHHHSLPSTEFLHMKAIAEHAA
jgi:hypothetical protein